MELGAVPNPNQDHVAKRTRRASSSDPQAAAVVPPLHVDARANVWPSKSKKASVDAALQHQDDVAQGKKTEDAVPHQVKSILKTKSKRDEKMKVKE